MKLKFVDVYNPDGSPREYINFRARSRKATPDGKRKTRQVPVHPILAESLLSYKPDSDSPWLFPSRPPEDKPISARWADAILRKAVDRGLGAPR